MGILAGVRKSTEFVVSQSKHVTIDRQAVDDQVEKLLPSLSNLKQEWREPFHYFDGTENTVQYILVLDALNFSFWKEEAGREKEEFGYVELAAALKNVLAADPSAFAADRLASITESTLRSWFGRKVLLEDERIRLLREVGTVLLREFDGKAANLVKKANHSVEVLLQLLTSNFIGFQDHAIYRGHQVYLYKRAQIFVADLWGAFHGEGLGYFQDIQLLTMFADYRVPQILNNMGILKYSKELNDKIENKMEIAPGSTEEVEIRAATIQAVEVLKERLSKKGMNLISVQIDWLLWNEAEGSLNTLPLHHRTRTIFY